MTSLQTQRWLLHSTVIIEITHQKEGKPYTYRYRLGRQTDIL